MDDIVRVAENVINTDYSKIPGQVSEMTKLFILDTLGTAIAGSSAPGCQQVVEQVKEWGGREESTVWVFGGRVPSILAALANGTMAHAWDFDDAHDVAGVHNNASVLPAALAVAEAEGSVSGKELITAATLGVDLACRLGLSIRLYKGWHYTGICGIFGATAAVGKILKLDQKRMAHAFGIAYSQASGTVQTGADGALTKRMQPAFAAHSAILSGYEAAKGITGARDVLQGRFGFFNVYDGYKEGYSPKGQIRFTDSGLLYGQHHLTADLGVRFESANLSFKPYPCCRANHGIIGATLKSVLKEDLKPEQIEGVEVTISPWVSKLVGRPFQITENFLVDAQFSAIYSIAAAILRRDVFLDSFTEEAIKDPRIQELAAKVKLTVDPQIKHKVPITVKIGTKGGQVYSETVHSYKGMPEDPLTPEECRDKFLKCTRFSIRPMGKERAEAIVGGVGKLEEMKDIRELTNLLK